jgi:hypothetical protein
VVQAQHCGALGVSRVTEWPVRHGYDSAGAKLRTYQLGDLVAASWFTGRPQAGFPSLFTMGGVQEAVGRVRPGRRPYDFIVRRSEEVECEFILQRDMPRWLHWSAR